MLSASYASQVDNSTTASVGPKDVVAPKSFYAVQVPVQSLNNAHQGGVMSQQQGGMMSHQQEYLQNNQRNSFVTTTRIAPKGSVSGGGNHVYPPHTGHSQPQNLSGKFSSQNSSANNSSANSSFQQPQQIENNSYQQQPTTFNPSTDASIINHANNANRVCAQIDDLVGTLHRLHQENQTYKRKYLDAKKDHFTKFFTETATGLLASILQAWRKNTQEARMDREIAALRADIDRKNAASQELLNKREARFEQVLIQRENDIETRERNMNAELDHLEERSLQLQASYEEAKIRFEENKSIFKEFKGRLSHIEVAPTPRPIEQSYATEFIKDNLHYMLQTTDTNYVPPIGQNLNISTVAASGVRKSGGSIRPPPVVTTTTHSATHSSGHSGHHGVPKVKRSSGRTSGTASSSAEASGSVSVALAPPAGQNHFENREMLSGSTSVQHPTNINASQNSSIPPVVQANKVTVRNANGNAKGSIPSQGATIHASQGAKIHASSQGAPIQGGSIKAPSGGSIKQDGSIPPQVNSTIPPATAATTFAAAPGLTPPSGMQFRTNLNVNPIPGVQLGGYGSFHGSM